MAADQRLLDLAGSLLQTIAKTQENLGEKLVEAEGLGPESSSK